jgi:two-component system, LytTR family, sensor histidine kinase AlgZ
MQDSQLLSVFPELSPEAPADLAQAPAQQRLVFDACHVGVILRAVLFVEAVVAVGAMYGAGSLIEWLTRTSMLTGGALPSALLWLIVACSLKRVLARLSVQTQVIAGVSLGALAGLYGCGLLVMVGMTLPAPWVASAFTGAILAGALVAALIWRARGMAPATTSARLLELQSRIRPHFLFNTLNSAIALVRAEPAKAEALLEDLSDLFRHALMDQGEAVSLADEVALAHRYLAIEEIRFGDRLRVEWSIDPAADGARLPPLLLQPLVENAVRHGVEPSDSGATVRVSTQRRGSMAVIKVTNTVPQGQGERGHGVALENVRARLNLMHDVQGRFQCGLKDGIFQVRMEVPL